MGIFSSAAKAVTTSFDVVTQSVDVVGKTVEMASSMVNHRAVMVRLTDKQEVMASTADKLMAVQERLDTDEKFAKIFHGLSEEFD